MTANSSPRIYKLGERECTTLGELAAAMNELEDTAEAHLQRGYIQKWIEEELREYDARIALDNLIEELGPHRAMFEFALRYSPGVTPYIAGLPTSEAWLDDYIPQLLKDDYIVSTDNLQEFAGKVWDWNILTDDRVFPNSERFRKIDEIWRREFTTAALTRGEMLLYRDLYRVDGPSLGLSLFDNKQIELTFAKSHAGGKYSNPEHFAIALDNVGGAGKLDLLVELLNCKDLDNFDTGYRVENSMYYDDALSRNWFVEMLEKTSERSPGRETALRIAARLAAHQAGDVKAAAEAKDNADQLHAGKDRSSSGKLISSVDRRVLAGIAALAVFVSTFFYDPWDSGPLWICGIILSLGLTIGLAVFRPLPIKPESRWINWVGGIAVGALIFYLFEFDFAYSLFVPHVGFAILAGLAVYFREPLNAFRERKLERQASATNDTGSKNDTARIDPIALSHVFFPEQILDIPPSEMTEKQRRFAMRVRSGLADDTGITRHADSRSPVAPNNSSGVSMNVGGANVAGDRTTFEVMDGVSTDTDGNWNMRVADGVTLHNDGKHTVSMGGIDVRSDGQISTEIGGFRVSSKGKDEKADNNWLTPKEETDWFGNKKKKGWFD